MAPKGCSSLAPGLQTLVVQFAKCILCAGSQYFCVHVMPGPRWRQLPPNLSFVVPGRFLTRQIRKPTFAGKFQAPPTSTNPTSSKTHVRGKVLGSTSFHICTTSTYCASVSTRLLLDLHTVVSILAQASLGLKLSWTSSSNIVGQTTAEVASGFASGTTLGIPRHWVESC